MPSQPVTTRLPINLEDLLRQRTVERDRIEYKAGWNPDPIIRTLCAFANDFENLGGGYVIIGQDCDDDGQPIFPPVGVPDNQLDKIQRELIQHCHAIQPPYFPILSIEEFAGKKLIVLWAPGGQTRPYSAPKEVTAKHRTSHYYIRRYSSTVEAKGDDQRELLSLAATVPFDDRMCRAATMDDISLPLVRSFLKQIGSRLYQERPKASLLELARLLNIVDGPDEAVTPRNVGVLFFSETPEQFLPGTQIDVVIFPQGAGGDQIVERILHGPIHQQIRSALRYIQNNVIVENVLKHSDRPEATRFFNYPMTAIEEALVNAMYHRGYDQREPVEVRVNPGSIQIVSYPGPDPSIRPTDLKKPEFVSRRYRNRRIGEFFKELDMTEGRGTGVPKIRAAMKRNGSPRPTFETDENRLWFVAKLPIHKAFAGLPAGKFTPQTAGEVTPHVTPHVTPQVAAVLKAASTPCSREQLQAASDMKDREHFRKQYLLPLLEAGLIEMTIPEKPRSSKQQYRLTPAGKAALKTRGKKS
ncbi:transcriptional regulator [Candidatus Kaiserbacteria bacterium]|nr:transcriptional regulator [Candidatus Kaiserbacteria bacterium]